MKKVLMISYFYPPLNDVGVLRTTEFEKHLPDLGWRPLVLSVTNPDLKYCRLGVNSLQGPNAYRSLSIFNGSRFAGKANGLLSHVLNAFGLTLDHELVQNFTMIPDFANGWIPATVLTGRKIVENEKIDLIFATCKPNSAAIIGALLQRQTGVPLVLDFRDPWRMWPVQNMVGNSENAFPHFGDRLRDKIDLKLETWSLRQTRRVVVTTSETAELYLKLYPFLRDRIETIYNGYADEFFKDLDIRKYKIFTITYSGSYYYYLDKSEAFFEALASLSQDGQLKGKFRFLYIGGSSIVSKMIEKYGLAKLSTCAGYLDRKDATQLLLKSHVMLLKNIRPHLSTKLYEGLAAGLPILAMIDHKDEAGAIIRKYSPQSEIVAQSDSAAIGRPYGRCIIGGVATT